MLAELREELKRVKVIAMQKVGLLGWYQVTWILPGYPSAQDIVKRIPILGRRPNQPTGRPENTQYHSCGVTLWSKIA